jgi:hypothetical protein
MVKKKEVAATKNESVAIPPIELEYAKITIEGESPLIVNQFTEKAKTEIEEKQTGRAKAAKAFRDKEAEYQNSLYTLPKGASKHKYGMPLMGLKNVAVSACSFIGGISKVKARGAFHVVAEPGCGALIPIKGEPTMDESMVRIGPFGKKVAMPRYRGRFDKWEVTFKIKYNKNVISPEQILNLYENAGFSIGLCEWRPEKNGAFGMFRVKRG